jgi:hypothetical protein
MSANNWTTCPRCYVTQVAARKNLAENLLREAKASYGKVPHEEYHRLLLEADSARAAAEKLHDSFPETLREDYELGINDNDDFTVDYGATCTQCNWKFTFKHEQKVKY